MAQDDAALVERVLAGEKSAFGPLIDRYRPGAIRLARRMLGDAVEAEDITQEALLQAFLGLSSLRTPDRFGAWLLAPIRQKLTTLEVDRAIHSTVRSPMDGGS